MKFWVGEYGWMNGWVWIEGLIAVVRFSFFLVDVMGNRNMDGGSGGWKDICAYLYLQIGFNSFGSEC